MNSCDGDKTRSARWICCFQHSARSLHIELESCCSTRRALQRHCSLSQAHEGKRRALEAGQHHSNLAGLVGCLACACVLRQRFAIVSGFLDCDGRRVITRRACAAQHPSRSEHALRTSRAGRCWSCSQAARHARLRDSPAWKAPCCGHDHSDLNKTKIESKEPNLQTVIGSKQCRCIWRRAESPQQGPA
jgi:hypothetical protein